MNYRLLNFCALSLFLVLASGAAAAFDEDEGRVRLCNEGRREMTFASWTVNGANISSIVSCAARGVGCVGKGTGWTRLAPGDCEKIAVSGRISAWVSIWYRGDDGKFVLDDYDVNREWAGGSESGTSGTREMSMCGKWQDFEYHVAGNENDLKMKACAPGFARIAVNVLVRGDPEEDFSVTFRP